MSFADVRHARQTSSTRHMNRKNSKDSNRGSSPLSINDLAPAKARGPTLDQSDGRPVWFRSPKDGPHRLTGLSRAKLYELATDGRIRSVSLRTPGQSKGTRLFHLGSVLAYIESCEEKAVKEATEK